MSMRGVAYAVVGVALSTMATAATDDVYKCEPPLGDAQSIALVLGTVAGAAVLVTLASCAAGLAPIAPSRDDEVD